MLHYVLLYWPHIDIGDDISATATHITVTPPHIATCRYYEILGLRHTLPLFRRYAV